MGKTGVAASDMNGWRGTKGTPELRASGGTVLWNLVCSPGCRVELGAGLLGAPGLCTSAKGNEG